MPPKKIFLILLNSSNSQSIQSVSKWRFYIYLISCVVAASGLTGILKIVLNHDNFDTLLGVLIFQRFYPQSNSNIFTILYSKVIGLTEILIKLSALLFSIGFIGIILKHQLDISNSRVIVYIPPPTKIRRSVTLVRLKLKDSFNNMLI